MLGSSEFLTVLAVDDDPFALRRLKHAFSGLSGARLISTFGCHSLALRSIEEIQPDVVILAINPDGTNGLALAESIECLPLTLHPVLIFVSALEEHAVQAAEKDAAGYLLKPIATAKLERALDCARRRCCERAAISQVAELNEVLATIRAQRPLAAGDVRHETELWVPWANTYERLQVTEIDWIEAEGDYVRIHACGKSYLLRETMARMERRLGAQAFPRVHRSALVNQPKVALIQRQPAGRFALQLNCGTRVPVGRTYLPTIQKWMAALEAA